MQICLADSKFISSIWEKAQDFLLSHFHFSRTHFAKTHTNNVVADIWLSRVNSACCSSLMLWLVLESTEERFQRLSDLHMHMTHTPAHTAANKNA